MAQELLQGPLDTQRFEESWSWFFVNVSGVQKVTELLTPDTSLQLLAAGQNWQGTNWNTSKASKVLYTLTGVPIVKAAWPEYRNAFLYALSLHLEVEILEQELTDRVADAAFTLAQVFSGQVDWAAASGPGYSGSAPGDDAVFSAESLAQSEDDGVQIAWDEPLRDLPLELATCGPTPSLGSATWT